MKAYKFLLHSKYFLKLQQHEKFVSLSASERVFCPIPARRHLIRSVLTLAIGDNTRNLAIWYWLGRWVSCQTPEPTKRQNRSKAPGLQTGQRTSNFKVLSTWLESGRTIIWHKCVQRFLNGRMGALKRLTRRDWEASHETENIQRQHFVNTSIIARPFVTAPKV